MRFLLPIACAVVLFSSCTRYQYMMVESNNTGKNDHQNFVAENDSVFLEYSFNGAKSPVNILVRNKLNQPMYVDWKRSALIINDQAVSYMGEKIPISGSFSGTTWNVFRSNSWTEGSVSATATVPGQLDFIPPQSYITKAPMGVSSHIFDNIPADAWKRENLSLYDGSVRSVKKASFTESNSPFRFKSYITLIVDNKPVFYEQSFYIAEIINTDAGPKNFLFMNQNRGNRFYLSSVTGFGKGMAVFAGVAIAGAAAAMNPNQNCNNCKPACNTW